MEMSRFHFAFGLKKAGFLGGTVCVSAKLGTRSDVLPSFISETS